MLSSASPRRRGSIWTSPVACGPCGHRKANGEKCGAELDPKGVHARSCRFGGWRVRKHSAVRDVLGKWLQSHGCQVFWEQVVPAASDRAEGRIDLLVHVPGWASPVYIDVTIVSALADEPMNKGAATRPGVAAELAEVKKQRDYPYVPVIGFAIEEHGRMGEKARAFVGAVAPASPVARAAALRGLYQSLGATLQRSAADAVLAAVPPTATGMEVSGGP